LLKLGAVYEDDDGNEKVSDIGRIMDLYPLRPELSRAVAETIATGADLNVQTYVLMIAAAIEAGGLDDFDNRSDEWKRSLRETTVDDFIAQLDLMMATRDCYYGKSVNENELALRGLSPRRTYRAHRQFGKMCKLIGLNFRDIDLPTPSMDEEDEVRDLLLTGMPDLIYNRRIRWRRYDRIR
jgi:HrpA-like RNA helicase